MRTIGTPIVPLTEILIYTYGPSTVIADEFGSIPNIDLLLIFGSWAARHSGEPGPPPTTSMSWS